MNGPWLGFTTLLRAAAPPTLHALSSPSRSALRRSWLLAAPRDERSSAERNVKQWSDEAHVEEPGPQGRQADQGDDEACNASNPLEPNRHQDETQNDSNRP